MGDIYEQVVKFIESSDLKDEVTMNFIDVLEDNMDDYDYVRDLLERGYRLPLTIINTKAKMHGGISPDKVYKLIKQEL
jgi:disulfide oxidoreductase YuzD